MKTSTEATKILRTVNNEEAFYFYEAVDKPIGQSARSLLDFLEKIKFVKLESLQFHLQREDFQNWIGKTLCDNKLAREIGRIPPSHDDDLRIKVQTIVEDRIKELRGASVAFVVNEDLAIVPSSAY